jgi:PDZ domain-containing protein
MTEDDHQSTGALSVPEAALPAAFPPPMAPVAGGPTRRRRWPWVLFIVVVLGLAVASRIQLDEYALQPGSAQSVQQFITVPADKAHPVNHPVLLTDVLIGRVNALSWVYYKLQSDVAFETVPSVTGGTAASELDAQGDLEMSQAEAAAKTAALTRLGYHVTATAAGAVIFGTFPGTPAYGVLDVGDVVTAVDGSATPTAAALSKALDHHASGETVTLSVRRGGTGAATPVRITLKSTVINLGYATDGKGPYVHVTLGIQPEDQVDYTYPFPVDIDVTNIGGPSAGLAMTLGVIDTLDGGSLTGGRTVAATGTIDAKGDVGDVGGVAQKTVAVENAGATMFFVPVKEYNAAMSQDKPGLKVYAVSSLNQVLAILAGHGGTVPPPVSASSTTPTTAAG